MSATPAARGVLALCLALVLCLPLLAPARADNGTPPDDTCLLFAARCIGKGNGNFYLYYKISTEAIALRAGDALEYDVYLWPDCPLPKGGVDIQLKGGASVRDSGAVDDAGLRAHGDALLTAARGRWLHRRIDLSRLTGETTERWDLVFEGDPPGLYVQFIDNVALARADGTRRYLYADGPPAVDAIDWREGYSKDARVAVVPRARVTDGADLRPLIDAELRVMRLSALAAEHRAELDYLDEILRREKQDDLRAEVAAARAAVPDPATYPGSADDYLAALHAARHRLAHTHPLMQKYTGHLVGHAHIDFQWLWEWPETLQVCKDTFGQAVRFMDEYPEFTFSQSSAALYAATEEHFPDLFRRIQEYVKAGRWEVLGGRWCEGDTNMISGESHARHFLYGQRWFREKLGVTAKVGWEPDTFGHCWTMPQMLRLAGIDTYYFCRAGKGKPLFHWEAPDGSRVLAFEEPAIKGGWYNGDVGPRQLQELLEFKDATGARDMLWVYGVGNHGGGPTRENIETALGLQQRHLANVRFSTATAFFDALKRQDLAGLPVVRDELNTVFEGCYTTHADMKRWNRDLESLTVAAETAAAFASRFGFAYPRAELTQTWRDLLWNHHHDTLPGTSIHPSYQLSRTMYERGLASSRRILDEATKLMAGQIDDAQAGDLFVLNTLGWARDAVVRVAARPGLPAGPLVAVAAEGEPRPVQREADGALVFVARDLPAFGYRVYRLRSGGDVGPDVKVDGGAIATDRFDVKIDPATGAVVRLFDKRLGREVVQGEANALRVDWEAPHGGSAWTIGTITKRDAPVGGEPLAVVESGPVLARLRVQRGYGHSSWMQDVVVYRDLDEVEFDLDVDWRERGTKAEGGPFLRAVFGLAVPGARARYAIPFGDIERPADGKEVPAQTWADLGNPEWGVALLNDCKQGHSARGGALTLSLIRSSYEPDPEPDVGRHRIRYALYPHAGSLHDAGVPRRGFEFGTAPVAAWLDERRGELPREQSFLTVTGALPTALKLSEDGDEWLLRCYESTGRAGAVTVRGAATALEVNFVEDPVGKADPAEVPLRAHEIKTLRLGR